MFRRGVKLHKGLPRAFRPTDRPPSPSGPFVLNLVPPFVPNLVLPFVLNLVLNLVLPFVLNLVLPFVLNLVHQGPA